MRCLERELLISIYISVLSVFSFRLCYSSSNHIIRNEQQCLYQSNQPSYANPQRVKKQTNLNVLISVNYFLHQISMCINYSEDICTCAFFVPSASAEFLL